MNLEYQEKIGGEWISCGSLSEEFLNKCIEFYENMPNKPSFVCGRWVTAQLFGESPMVFSEKFINGKEVVSSIRNADYQVSLKEKIKKMHVTNDESVDEFDARFDER